MTMTAVQILGLILVVGGISVLLGAAVGYYTGYSDALREQVARPRDLRRGEQ